MTTDRKTEEQKKSGDQKRVKARHESRMGFLQNIHTSEQRKVRAKMRKRHPLWFGFGYFGIIGWLVMTPLAAMLALGVWLDTITKIRMSFTLTGIFIGIILGLISAGAWVEKERKKIEKEREP